MFDHYARQVASRKLDYETALAAHEAAKADADALRQRVDTIRRQQQTITTARLNGTADASSAAEFVALAADLDVLVQLHAEAEAKADSLRPDAAATALKKAERELERVKSDAAHEALVSHTREVEILFTRCLAAVQKSARARGTARTAADAYRIDSDLLSCARQNTWLPADRSA